MAKFTLQLKDGDQIMLEVQGAYSLGHKKTRKANTRQCGSYKQEDACHQISSSTRHHNFSLIALPHGDRRVHNGNKDTSRPLFITSRPASSSKLYRTVSATHSVPEIIISNYFAVTWKDCRKWRKDGPGQPVSQ